MSPGRVNASSSLKIGRRPAVIGFVAVGGNRCTSLREARMREHEYGISPGSKNAAESVQGTFQIRSVHEDVVRNHEIELRVPDSPELAAGIDAEIELRMLGTSDVDHALGY